MNSESSSIPIQQKAVDSDLLGTPGSIKLYKYQCTDANSLMLDVVAADSALEPLTLTRIP